MDTLSKIKSQIENNPILLYMKGTPEKPQCGFSARVVSALNACGEEFSFVNVLDNPDIRQELPLYANWPTFPQLYLRGELIGGCDIVLELYQTGELQSLVKTAAKV
jgi:monothiol glutaredoxin